MQEVEIQPDHREKYDLREWLCVAWRALDSSGRFLGAQSRVVEALPKQNPQSAQIAAATNN